MAGRRLAKELADIKKEPRPGISLVTNETEMTKWIVLLLPNQPPFCKGAFKIEVVFPVEYPFKPPKITFKTKIYHPNIDEKGQICLPIISAEHWKPATKTYQVLQALLDLISNPEPEHPLRADLAEEYIREKKKFDKAAEEFTKKYAEKRCTAATTKSTNS